MSWLIKAYIKKWGKSISISFFIALFFFAFLFLNKDFIFSKIPTSNTTNIGMVGAYSIDNLPSEILDKISTGLTRVDEEGNIHPGAAKSWEIKDDGKTYVFHLFDNLKFSDGKKLDSDFVNYNFADAIEEKPDKQTVVFKLKEGIYSPFLVRVSETKIFKNNLIGIGEYRVNSFNINGIFVQSIDLQSIKNPKEKIIYRFRDTQDELKLSYMLGEMNEIRDINDLNYHGKDLSTFTNTKIEKQTNYSKLAVLFYDNSDPLLSDKRMRKALSYAIPNDFYEGLRNYTPYSPRLWASSLISDPYTQDYEHSKLLLKSASQSGQIHITIKSLPQYRKLADEISQAWKPLNIKTSIETVDFVPGSFQVYLGDIILSKDPDQYPLWHSNQPLNIANYRNLRIDKLLEDGRKTILSSDRKKIYADFQKYLLDDAPASFLYFPYTYTVKRK